jgi:8-hydroxy-5-deazaflavin:NADPH oxidoreductase
VLFYATDDAAADKTIDRLIRAAGFEPWNVGGVDSAGRIEAPGGDLHQHGFNGEVVDLDRARSATAGFRHLSVRRNISGVRSG